MTARVSSEMVLVVDIVEIHAGGLQLKLTPTAAESAALADRFGLVAVNRFAGQGRIAPNAQGTQFHLVGNIDAVVTQECVVTRKNFEADLTVPVDRLFVTQSDLDQDLEEVDIDAESPDEPDLILSDRIDIAAVFAEEFGLALDPYPRAPGAQFAGFSIGEETDAAPAEKSPFAKLATLRKKLS
ncbi:MAG: YceD family protein [Magnetospiraceae bacterium]